MNARDRRAGSAEGDGDHDFLLSYLGSAAWEERLAEARAQRQILRDGRIAATAGGPHAGRREPVARFPFPVPRPRNAERPPDAIPAENLGAPAPPVPVRTISPARRSYPAVILSGAGLLVGATLLLWANVGGESVGAPDANFGAGVTIDAPADLVTRNQPDTMSPIGPPVEPGPAARSTLAGVDALGTFLEDMAPSSSITVVTTARQAKALAGLDPAQATVSIRVTRFEIDRPTVSFYRQDDAEAAKRLADQLNGDTLDLTGFLPSPPKGALPVYLVSY